MKMGNFLPLLTKINYESKVSPSCWRAIGILSSLALLTVFWFGFFPYQAFMGDDLRLIASTQTGGCVSSFVNALTCVEFNKFRPVFLTFFHLESLAFGGNFRSYMYFNIFLELLNVCLVSFISWRLSRKQLLVAFSSGVMFIVSRFSYYNVLQVLGSMEGLALFLFLLLIITTLRAYEIKKPMSFSWPLLFYFLVIFTHERYVVVGGFLVAAILLAPINFKRRCHRYILTAIPLGILLINYSLKTFIFKSRFFEGTGGYPIVFDYHQFFSFMFTGFLNMVGFNVGPNYLSGLDIFGAGIIGFAIGGIFAVSLATLILAYHFRSVQKINLSDGRNIFLFLALFVLLLASASITFRQEYRWLYAPYIMIIFGIAYLSGKISSSKRLRYLLIILILTSAVSVDTFYRGYLDNIWFIGGLKFSNLAKEDIIDKDGANLSQKELFLIGVDDYGKGYLQEDTFFKFYTGNPDLRVHYVNSFENMTNYKIDDINNILVFSFNPIEPEFIDITLKARSALGINTVNK
jgi:hypothetical protein